MSHSRQRAILSVVRHSPAFARLMDQSPIRNPPRLLDCPVGQNRGCRMPDTSRSRMSTGNAKAALAKLQDLSTEQLTCRVVERRAFEAVVWGMPAVNFELMYEAAASAKGAWNQIIYWSRLPGWR